MSEASTTMELTEEGFLLRAPDGITTVKWVHVAEIVAYRRDPAGEDLLCLAFRMGHTGQYVEVHEELPEYRELLEHLYEAFPEISHDWWQDVTKGMGPNRVTLYGLPATDENQPSPAERYLEQIQQRKRMTRSQWIIVVWACVGVFLVAGVQTFASWLLARWNPLLAVGLLPILLVFLVARRVGRPRTFFLLLVAFHLSELLWGMLLGWPAPSLLGQFLHRKFSYLLLLGGEILLGMFAMLLPNRRALGPKLR